MLWVAFQGCEHSYTAGEESDQLDGDGDAEQGTGR